MPNHIHVIFLLKEAAIAVPPPYIEDIICETNTKLAIKAYLYQKSPSTVELPKGLFLFLLLAAGVNPRLQ